MKVLSHCIESYMFLMGQAKVMFVSPKQKFRLSPDDQVKEVKAIKKASLRYRMHKKMAVDACRQMLLLEKLDRWVDVLESASKKDDLADCFLQGIVSLYQSASLKPQKTQISDLEVGQRVVLLRGKRKNESGTVSKIGAKKCKVVFGDGKHQMLSASSLRPCPAPPVVTDVNYII